METFVGLDVSLGETSVCILDKDGARIFEGKVASEPAAIARLIRKRAPGVVRVGLESGPMADPCAHGRGPSGCLSRRPACTGGIVGAAQQIRPRRRAWVG